MQNAVSISQNKQKVKICIVLYIFKYVHMQKSGFFRYICTQIKKEES